jgi:muramoyltetrapeptide carboxypeptidase
MKKIFLTAPSFALDKKNTLDQIKILRNHFDIVYQNDIFDKWYKFAGTEERRIDELNNAIRSDADIIWAIRGGYGVSQILSKIDFRSEKKKVFIGFSDFSAIGSIAIKFGHKFIYGPMLFTFNYQKSGTKTLFKLLNGDGKTREYRLPYKKNLNGYASVFCLKLLVNLLGTPFEPKFKRNTILFLEDVGERAYAIDRDLMQLYHSYLLKNVKAIFFNFVNVYRENDIDLKEHIKKVFYDKDLFWGLKFGHSQKFIPIIYGERVEIKNEKIIFYDNFIY